MKPMNEKLSFQNIADTLVQKTGVSKKSSDTFVKAFFDTIVEALSNGEETIKVKGWGTFKLVAVESRESVNVSNGERIVIPGYKKVAFTPEESVVEFLNQKAELDTLIQVPEPKRVEQPQDEFARIDMLIATPESIDEIRQQYDEARKKMDEAVEEARQAHVEKLRLEKLLERMEANVVPEEMEKPLAEKEPPSEQAAASVVEAATPSLKPPSLSETTEMSEQEKDKRQDALKRYMQAPSENEKAGNEKGEMKKPTTKYWVTVLVSLLLVAIGFFLYKTLVSIESVEDVPLVEKPVQPAKSVTPTPPMKSAPVAKVPPKKDMVQKTDSVVNTDTRKDSVNTQPVPVEAPAPARPATYRMQRGESLTRISQRFYGTKDSVRAIIRANTFKDPDNVPVGAVVKLP